MAKHSLQQLDAFQKREVLAILAVGCSRRTAARYVGCTEATITRAAEGDEAFATELRRKECQAEIALIKNIQDAGKKAQYWRAAAWVLERKNPEDYLPRAPETVTVEQIRRLLADFAQVIVEEVPVARYRKAILRRLEQMSATEAK